MNTLTRQAEALTAAIAPAVGLWADSKTDPSSPRRGDLLKYKANIVLDFFSHVGKPPAAVTPLDVKEYQAHLEALTTAKGKPLAKSTVYARISQISSFYQWAVDNDQARHNPVALARPKAPKAYQSESTKALSDDQARALLQAIKTRADLDLIGKRDYALALFYFGTGKRRREIIQLCWGDLHINGTVVVTSQVKGGDYVSFEVYHPAAKAALLGYLESAGRLDSMTPDSPLWVNYDPTGIHAGKPLSSHGFAKSIKAYAAQAGLPHFNLHQIRHTVGRVAAEEYGDLTEVQHVLGHKNLNTTRVYVQRIGVKRDKISSRMFDRLGVE